jgi:uncharacterized protein (TIGR01777 family)
VRILITGSSGFIGRNLIPPLRDAQHQVFRLLRNPSAANHADAIYFDSANPDPSRLSGFDAVIHLAGESVARRWTKKRKASILASRADFTRSLCTALAQAKEPPAHFLCASGISYYGYDCPEPFTDSSSAGEGFLAEVTRQWEAATNALAQTTRIVLMRLGPVLSAESGLLAKLLPPFRKGVGAVMGSGRQLIPWISLADTLAAIQHILQPPDLAGPVIVASPNPVTNRAFAKALATALHRPLLFRIPAPLIKLAFGEMATETILASQNAHPDKLLASGFAFGHVQLEKALDDILS